MPTLSEQRHDPSHLVTDNFPLGGRKPRVLSCQLISLDVLGAWNLERKRTDFGNAKAGGRNRVRWRTVRIREG